MEAACNKGLGLAFMGFLVGLGVYRVWGVGLMALRLCGF